MADEAMLAEATQSLSFAEFLERMKDPAASDLVRHIKQFIKTFDDRRPDPDRDSRLVQEFMTASEGLFRQHPVWASAPAAHQGQAMEGLEKYLMTKIYSKTFAVSELDRERDEALLARMSALAFVQPHHLDIPAAYQDEGAWVLAMKELHKINNYKAPRDKIVCILNCCRVINNLLHVAAQAGEARGADDFLPVLIYVVIHANPPQLASNLEYIQRFRMESRMVSESSYFYTQLYSAASFVETINTQSLSMEADEFIAHMVAGGVPDMQLIPNPVGVERPVSPPQNPKASTPPPLSGFTAGAGFQQPSSGSAEFRGASASPLAQSTKAKPFSAGLGALPSAAELEREGATLVIEAEASGQLQGRHPFLYSAPPDLRLADVAALLQEYKELALRYEALSLAVDGRRAAGVHGRPLTPLAIPQSAKSGGTLPAYGSTNAVQSPASSSPHDATQAQYPSRPSPRAATSPGETPAAATPPRPGGRVPDSASPLGFPGGTRQADQAPSTLTPALAYSPLQSAGNAGTALTYSPLQSAGNAGAALTYSPLQSSVGGNVGASLPDQTPGRDPFFVAPSVPSTAPSSVGALEDDVADILDAAAAGNPNAANLNYASNSNASDDAFSGLLSRQGELADPSDVGRGSGGIPSAGSADAAAFGDGRDAGFPHGSALETAVARDEYEATAATPPPLPQPSDPAFAASASAAAPASSTLTPLRTSASPGATHPGGPDLTLLSTSASPDAIHPDEPDPYMEYLRTAVQQPFDYAGPNLAHDLPHDLPPVNQGLPHNLPHDLPLINQGLPHNLPHDLPPAALPAGLLGPDAGPQPPASGEGAEGTETSGGPRSFPVELFSGLDLAPSLESSVDAGQAMGGSLI